MKSSRFVLVWMILISFLLSGCWDRVDIDLITFPLALGIERSPEGGGYKVYAQVAESKISGQGSSAETQFKVLESEGETISRALTSMAERIQQYISWQHTKAVVVSEDLARTGLKEIYESLSRYQEFRLTMYTLVTKSNIKELFEVRPVAETTLPTQFQAVKPVKDRTSEVIPVMLRQFATDMFLQGENPVHGRVELVANGKKKELQFAGGAAFRKDKMVGWMSNHDALAWLFIRENTGN